MRPITAYLHGSKEAMWDKGEAIGLSGEALGRFSFALYEVEVEVELEVNEETGEANIIRVNGKELKEENDNR